MSAQHDIKYGAWLFQSTKRIIKPLILECFSDSIVGNNCLRHVNSYSYISIKVTFKVLSWEFGLRIEMSVVQPPVGKKPSKSPKA